VSDDGWVAIASLAALATAGMNVYTYVTTGGQINTLIRTVESQANAAAQANQTLGTVLQRSQDQLDRLIDRFTQPGSGGA
jgi:hypothetical protein